MKGIARWASALLIVAGLCLWLVGSASAAGPPIITKVEAQVTVLSGGGLDVKYRLTFHETEPRSGITSMGPFDPSHEMLDYRIEHADTEFPVVLDDQGGGFYGVDFGFDTEAGEDYTVHVHYAVDYGLDETTVDGQSYRVLEWSPIEWSLEIGEQVVTLILPIELPADITEPEQVTDEIVDEAGILVDEAMVSSFDRWVYYPTPDEVTGKNWLSIYVSKTALPPEYHFRPKVYVPARHFPDEPEPTPIPSPWPTSTPARFTSATGIPRTITIICTRWTSTAAVRHNSPTDRSTTTSPVRCPTAGWRSSVRAARPDSSTGGRRRLCSFAWTPTAGTFDRCPTPTSASGRRR